MKALACILALLVCGAHAQQEAVEAPDAPIIAAAGEFQDDPSQALYKSGYSNILEKNWDAARKTFQQLVTKYPGSKYVDAAKYWTAYSYLQTDQKKALEFYRQFIETYPQSTYFDDAIADLEKLGYDEEGREPREPPVPEHYEKAAELYERAQQFELQRALLEKEAQRLATKAPQPHGKLDPDSQMKVEAIYALSHNREDAQSFETLKAIALDTNATREVRAAALQGLHNFKKFDLASVFLAVAQTGNTELRQETIMMMGHLGLKDNTRIVEVLSKYLQDAKQPRPVRAAALMTLVKLEYTGLYPLVERLVKSGADSELRQEALFILARSGRSEEGKAIALLKSIATDKSESTAMREAAVHALLQLDGKESFAILKSIATTDPDAKMRLGALYALGTQRGESKAEMEQLMKQIASKSSEDRETRIAALYSLREAEGDKAFDLYKDMALREKDEQVRQAAVYLLTQSQKDKTKSVGVFIEIYGKASVEERTIRESALYGIARVGNEKAVDFLKNVAKSDPDYEMRRRAIYFLGSVGGEQAKAALIDILKK